MGLVCCMECMDCGRHAEYGLNTESVDVGDAWGNSLRNPEHRDDCEDACENDCRRIAACLPTMS
jgi:hypothetical protein